MWKTAETFSWSIAASLIEAADTIALTCIGIIAPPFDHYYTTLHRILRQHFIKRGIAVPSSLASDYSRVALAVPTVTLLASTHQRVLPSFLILLNYLGGIFDDADHSISATESPSAFSDDKGFHVLSTGSPQRIPSWTHLQVLYKIISNNLTPRISDPSLISKFMIFYAFSTIINFSEVETVC
jgi:hypothetical protein